jgi:hypothetical protein
MSENTFGFSLLKNPIYFETPRMRKFYEQNQFLD